ncbi:glutathione peroxidase [Hymenobacter jejuensis]|uniref:Glutathione peroxidase n=1 Tax=Hymenobacter jejuensis TaxID=2502781 RepID=A0A5B8A3R6_9BACT|nr:glutathione peroxidase [Hymenobacter jejuensis]QDA61263.1 glutathione peroxidase [Hymenobacter jejuensis]
MKASFTIVAATLALAGLSSYTFSQPVSSMIDSTTEAPAAQGTVYDYTVKTIDGKEVKLSQYKGKKLLIVNTASECGFTPQYKELEELYKKHGDKVVVLGFPANNFGGQEPGTNSQIATFCEKNYGVSFPLFSKISVKGDDTDPLYKFLSDKGKNGVVSDAPTWNFCKYLIDEQGHVVKFYPSKVKPMSDELLADILK